MQDRWQHLHKQPLKTLVRDEKVVLAASSFQVLTDVQKKMSYVSKNDIKKYGRTWFVDPGLFQL